MFPLRMISLTAQENNSDQNCCIFGLLYADLLCFFFLSQITSVRFFSVRDFSWSRLWRVLLLHRCALWQQFHRSSRSSVASVSEKHWISCHVNAWLDVQTLTCYPPARVIDWDIKFALPWPSALKERNVRTLLTSTGESWDELSFKFSQARSASQWLQITSRTLQSPWRMARL